MSSICMIGAGNMATALTICLSNNGHRITMYSIEPEVTEEINTSHENKKYLPGVRLLANITATNNLETALTNAQTVFVAVPSSVLCDVFRNLAPLLTTQEWIVSASKGLDLESGQPLLLCATAALPSKFQQRVVMLGGPAVANEIAAGSPTAMIAGCAKIDGAEFVAQLLGSSSIKIATSCDTLGVAMAAALKNPYAIALGMCDGLGYSTNAKAWILTKAIDEIAMLTKTAGADAETAHGLAGIGDLVVTGFSPYGRNRTFGERLVKASSKNPSDLGLGIVEGIAATQAAINLANQQHTVTPLLSVINECLQAKSNFAEPFRRYVADAK